MRRWVLGIGAAGALLIPRWSAAETTRAGDLGVGADVLAGYIIGPYHYEGPVAPGYGTTGTVEFDPMVSGWTGGFLIVFGIAPADRWMVSAESGMDLLLLSTDGYLSGTSINSGFRGAMMLGATYSLTPEWRLRASAGFVGAWFGSSQLGYGSADNIVDPEPVVGPGARIVAAWAPEGVGGLLRVGYARLEGDQSSWAPFDVAIGVIFTSP